MSKKLLLRLAVLVAAMMCALDASAAKAYVFYTSSDSTLTFYYDDLMWYDVFMVQEYDQPENH